MNATVNDESHLGLVIHRGSIDASFDTAVLQNKFIEDPTLDEKVKLTRDGPQLEAAEKPNEYPDTISEGVTIRKPEYIKNVS